MKTYLVLFREPDGRAQPHPEADIARHRANWKTWLEEWSGKDHIAGGSGLTLEGSIIRGNNGDHIANGIHQVGTEIVGGFLLLKAASLHEATAIAASCPIFEFDGYAEVRELQAG